MNIAQYSTAYSNYSLKTAATTAILKKELDSAAQQVTGTVSQSMNSTLASLNTTSAANPLSSSSTVDISI